MALISDLPNATPQKSDLMEIQNGQTSSNNSSVGQLMQLSASENLAPAYDANAGVYAVGDFVSYDGTLYQCNTAIATPEAFDATKWDAVKVTELSGRASVIQLTQAEYTALTTAEKMNGSIYKLTDKAIFYCLDEEYHAVKELTSAQYDALTTAEKNNGTIYIQTDKETTGSDIPVSTGETETIAEALEYKEESVTVPTYGGTITCHKFGRVVSIALNGLGSTSVYPQGSKLTLSGIIPQEYRPTTLVGTYGNLTGSESGQTSALYSLSPNGNIEIYAYSNIASGGFSISYIV